MEIKLYYIINNNKISSDKVPIFNDISKLISSINNDYKNGKNDIDKFLFINLIEKNEDRNLLMIKIFENIQEENLIIKNFIIIPDGRIIGIKNFETTINNIKEISIMGYESIKNILTLDNIGTKLNESENKIKNAKDILEYIKEIVKLGTIYEVLEKEFDLREEKMENNLKETIIKNRRKIVEEEEKEIKNEFELLEKQVQNSLCGKCDLKINNCKYNGIDLSYDELVEELYSHKFPQYMTEKNIQDTLDDEYEIDSNYFYIKRTKGGNINIKIKK